MARIFTTFFSYKDNLYTAVITRNDGIVTIYVPDESLHSILPAGKATFNSQEGLKIDTHRLSPAQHLILNILTSIEKQSEAEQVIQRKSEL